MVCSDKTGTLTENVMEVTDIYTASHQHAMVHSATSGSKVLCGEREVTPDTHPDVIKVVEVRREERGWAHSSDHFYTAGKHEVYNKCLHIVWVILSIILIIVYDIDST